MINKFTAKNVLVQGITGTHGSFQTRAMLAAGTNVVAGTSPGKKGLFVSNVPVYSTVASAQVRHRIDISVIFVPAPFAEGAILEAIDAEVPLIVVITENIPVHDMLQIRQKLADSSSTLLGPNSPGALLPGINKLGIIPATMALPGNTAIVSRSGTLTYEAMAGLTTQNIGQRYVIGVGGDQIHGLGFIDCLKMFESDPEVDRIVLIGEIGGSEELEAAAYIESSVKKPVFAYVAGHHAPAGIQLGHAGAILGSAKESAGAKTEALKKAGATVAQSIAELVRLMAQ